ncbi:hypothetical protein PF003_g977 [Phytophthora fragariae]|nr:hypothetical protein PF003_g977 [Phytophthora fragariae]
MLDLPSSIATHPTFYVGLLKPYRPVGAAEPEEPTASQNTAERRSPSSERDLPREAGQAQEPEPDQEHEPLRGEPLAPPSNPTGRTDHGTRRGASPGSGAPARRSPRLANIGHASSQRHHPAAEADPRRGSASSPSPLGHPGGSPGGLHILDASAKRYHLGPLTIQQSLTRLHTGEKALQVRTRASRTTLSVLVRYHCSRGLRRLCLVMRASSTTMSRSY